MKLTKLVLIGALCMLSVVTCLAQKKKKKDKKGEVEKFTLKNQVDTISYGIGVSIGKNLKTQGLDSINTQAFAKALEDIYKNDSVAIKPEKANEILTKYFMNLQVSKMEKNKKASDKFLTENKAKAGVVTLPSGLQYQIIKEGTGPQPKPTDTVTTHYKGTLLDGTVFDSSYDGEPVSFPVNGVIQGWQEALPLMKVGSKYKLFIPANLAYGDRGTPGIPPNSTLIFEVELLAIGQKK